MASKWEATAAEIDADICAKSRRPCEKFLSFASSLALYAEEIDAPIGRHLGNFPEVFTDLALINAVMPIIHAEQQPELGATAGEREFAELVIRPAAST